MFLGGSVPPWAGGAEGDGSPPAANCGIRAVRPLRYSGLRQALREKKRKSLRNHEISVRRRKRRTSRCANPRETGNQFTVHEGVFAEKGGRLTVSIVFWPNSAQARRDGPG